MRIVLSLVLVLSFFSSQAQEKKYTIVFLTLKAQSDEPSTQPQEKTAGDLKSKLKILAADGKLLNSGSFEGGGRILLLNTASVSEAELWVNENPRINRDYWAIEILPYLPTTGALCKTSASEEFVTYSLVRFDAIISKFTASTYPEIIRKHDEYVRRLEQTGNVVTVAVFGALDGGMVVMKGQVDDEVFEMDPGVQEGLLEITIRSLRIAKGSFCEK
jgi:hypothetical protein